MKDLLTETSPAQAYQMFAQTFTKEQLPAMLDNAFIPFTNVISSLRTTCIATITAYANQLQNANHLDVLAICHLFNNAHVLYGMLGNLRDDLANHQKNIDKAVHQRTIMGDIFCNDLHQAYTQTINKYKKMYAQVKQNIYTVEAMIFLIKDLKK